MVKLANATERSDLHHRLIYAAIKAADSKSDSEVERCFDSFRYLKNMNLSVKEIRDSEAIFPLQSLRHHKNPKIRTEVEVLFNSWRKTLHSHGRDTSTTTCNKALPLNLKKKPNVVKVCSVLNKKEPLQRSHDVATDTERPHQVADDDCESFAAKPIQRKKQSSLRMKLSENPRSRTHEVGENKQNLKKPIVVKVCSVLNKKEPLQRSHDVATDTERSHQVADDDCESFAPRPIQKKKQLGQRMKLSENPKSSRAHEVGENKQNLKKQPLLKVSKNPILTKNATEMLELFEIAKKSADVANAKGLLAAKAESSICVDTLSLLISYPISSTANETRQIMEKLERLTKHKDRKICNSATALLQHWRQSIRDQQQD